MWSFVGSGPAESSAESGPAEAEGALSAREAPPADRETTCVRDEVDCPDAVGFSEF